MILKKKFSKKNFFEKIFFSKIFEKKFFFEKKNLLNFFRLVIAKEDHCSKNF